MNHEASATRRRLFTPGHIGGVITRNRIVMPPMTTRLADPEGTVTEALIAYYAARAAGGAGLITLEMASPEKNGRHRAHELGIYDDRFIPGLTCLTAEMHRHGAKVSVQLGHAGSRTRQDISGELPMAPSAFPQTVFEVTSKTIVPVEMTVERITRSIAAFGAAAERAAKAGFDCVELQFAHGYLVSQFLCPYENRRTDSYGGSLENRARFGLEIIRHIKKRVPELPVVVRLSAESFFPEGASLSEGLAVSRWIAEAGADAINVSAGHYRSLPSAAVMAPPMRAPSATFLTQALAVKQVVGDLPIIAVGRFGDPAQALEALEQSKVDFVALGRPLIADPDWPRKVQAGGAVRRCLACNTCINEMRNGQTIGCYVNPTAGRELEFAKYPSLRGERIAVIGAGPAGLSFASLVAEHCRVTVFDRAGEPGGALRDAGKAPRFQDVEATDRTLLAYIAELERDCRVKGVEFRYGVNVSAEPKQLQDFDLVVVATGAAYRFGLQPLARVLLNSRFASSKLIAWLFDLPRFRNLFYYKLRRETGSRITQHIRSVFPDAAIMVIGDAKRAGKGQAAIRDAFVTALHDLHGRSFDR